MSHPSQHPTGWRIVRDPVRRPDHVVTLDPAQRRLVEKVRTPGHGPVLLLAGPGTGKTTTLVEAVAARVADGTDPGRILTLTFSRKAATELRTRIGARLGRTVSAPLAWTFHGFGFSLLAAGQIQEDRGRPLRLISGPEQDVAVRDLLSQDREIVSVDWPEWLHQAIPTRGFTDEVRALLTRARSLGLGPADFRAAARGRADWTAAAQFLDEYLDVLDSRGVVDYAELVARAVAYAESDAGRRHLRSTYDLVLVDEYQDTDPAGERLLQAIGGQGRDLVVVGDPDQSIYAFRGADVGGIMNFADRFQHIDGRLATTLVLGTSRRCGTEILDASRRVASRLGGAGSSLVHHLQAHRALAATPDQAPGSVEIRTFSTPELEAMAIADLLRREHLQRGTPWHDMAVLVRSGIQSIPHLRRVLGLGGVPVEVAGDELPLAGNVLLEPLLLALSVVADPSSLTPAVARDLMLSPLVGADPACLRRLGRALREQSRGTGPDSARPLPSDRLLATALDDPHLLAGVPRHIAEPARRLVRLLNEARMVSVGGTAHEVLWSIWSGTDWPQRMQQASYAGGPSGRAADRTLDAVVSLFEVAARSGDAPGGRGVRSFLAEVGAQQIPGDTLAERSARPSGVRLLTAHRSKGLEWSVVVVAGVQAELWPDVRQRGSLLQADRLGRAGPEAAPTREQLRRDERRLFYVAITRAKRRLIVTAVESAADDGVRPSPFLAELGCPVPAPEESITRPLTLRGLTAELRSVVVDPAASSILRRAAADRLAVIASTTVNDDLLVPAAHPDHWYGVLAATSADRPLRSTDKPIELSGSQLEQLAGCPLRWFFTREAQAAPPRGAAAGLGGVLHALADGVASGTIDDQLQTLLRHADSVWPQLPHRARWEAARERQELSDALERFIEWHHAQRGRRLVGSEQEFSAPITVGDRQVVLRGRLDRLELDEGGRAVVVDLKTGRTVPSRKSVATNIQLAAYQRTVAESALPGVCGPSGGAELVHLRVPPGASDPGAKVQTQPPYPDGEEQLDQVLSDAVSAIDREQFPATPGDGCKRCAFTRSCPAQQEGRHVVT